MPSPAFDEFLRVALTAPDFTTVPLEQNRRDFDAQFAAVALPPGVTYEAIDRDGVAGEWVLPPTKPDRVILYFHGGGFRAGSRIVGRPIAAQLAVQARARVLNAEYRLAPEHPFPAAVEDAVHTYRWLTSQADAAHVAIAGESAGANLAIDVLLTERDMGHPLPTCAYLMSPSPDSSPSWSLAPTRQWRDPWIRADAMDRVTPDYLGANPHLVTHPLVSPVFADLAGLPRMLVQVGELEPFRDAIIRFAAKARRSGVDLTLDEGEGMFHCWPVVVGVFPEADEALARAASYLRDNTPAGPVG